MAAAYGAAMYASSSAIILSGSSCVPALGSKYGIIVRANTVQYGGAGMYLLRSQGLVHNAAFVDNKGLSCAAIYGTAQSQVSVEGAIHLYFPIFLVRNICLGGLACGVFHDLSSQQDTKSLLKERHCIACLLTLKEYLTHDFPSLFRADCLFVRNVVRSSGGVFCILVGSTLTSHNTIYEDNFCANFGGVVSIFSNCVLHMRGDVFRRNIATNSGGAIGTLTACGPMQSRVTCAC